MDEEDALEEWYREELEAERRADEERRYYEEEYFRLYGE